MSQSNEIFNLVRLHLPDQKLTGPGIIPCSTSQSKREFTGNADADMYILLLLPDPNLGDACNTSKTIANIGTSPEFWRQKLSIVLNHQFPHTNQYNYKEIYQRLHRGKTVNTKLIIAAQYGYLDIIKLLIEKGADIRAAGNEELRMAKSYDEIILAMVNSMIFYDKSSTSVALIVAIMHGQLEVVKYLLTFMKIIKPALTYVLECAARYGHLEIVKHIIDHTEYTLDVSTIGTTLAYGIKGDSVEIVEYLLGRYATHNDELIEKGFKNAAWFGNLRMLNYFIEKGVDIHVEHDEALRLAVNIGHLSIVKYLVEIDGIPHNIGIILREAVDRSTSTILPVSAKHLSIIKYLISKGANKHYLPLALRKKDI
jgi:ankyrin repeat protein